MGDVIDGEEYLKMRLKLDVEIITATVLQAIKLIELERSVEAKELLQKTIKRID